MTTISIRVEDSEKETIQKYAVENDLTMSQVIRKAIKEFFEQKEES